MIAFGTAITAPEQYRRYAQPGIALAKEADSEVLALSATGSIFRSYNLLLDQAGKLDGLEALVLVHQDSEIADPDLCGKIREILADPDVGVIGAVGALGVRSIAWWEGSVTWASFIHRYQELGGGDIRAFSWTGEDQLPPYAHTGEVDTVDGFMLVLSPWVVRNVRFDESLGQLHGYDFDFCLSVREAGKKVMTADFRAIHHHSLDLVSEPNTWVEAHMRVAEKWDGRMPGVGVSGGDWKLRARRAEAEAEVTRAAVVSGQLQHEARVKHLKEQIEEMTSSTSWRVTKPLREVALRLKRRRNGSS